MHIVRSLQADQVLMALYEKLDEAESQETAGAICLSHEEVMANLRLRLMRITE